MVAIFNGDSLELEVRGKLDMLQGAEIKAAAAVG